MLLMFLSKWNEHCGILTEKSDRSFGRNGGRIYSILKTQTKAADSHQNIYLFLKSSVDSSVWLLVVDRPRAPSGSYRLWVIITWVMVDASVYPQPDCGGAFFAFSLKKVRRKWKYRVGNMAWRKLYFYFKMFLTNI